MPSTGYSLAASEADPRMIPGSTIGRYELRAPLGGGTMAAVWSAVDTATAQEVALKVLHPEMAVQDEIVQRFDREAYCMQRGGSKCACRLLDRGTTGDDRPYLVLENLHGRTLADWINASERLSFREFAPVCGALLKALALVHDAGIVHRDVKPANVFVEQDDRGEFKGVRVLDFGVSKVHDAACSASELLTGNDTVAGSLAYIAPEQVHGTAGVDARADLYSAGVVAFRALSGRLPFQGVSLSVLLVLKLEWGAPSLQEVTAQWWPEAIESFVRRSLAREPGARFQHAGEMDADWDRVWHAVEQGAPGRPRWRVRSFCAQARDRWRANPPFGHRSNQ